MASARVICPHCNAKLRISTSGGLPTRAKCHHCRTTFTPAVTGEVGGAALYLDPATADAPLASGSVQRTEPGAPPLPALAGLSVPDRPERFLQFPRPEPAAAVAEPITRVGQLPLSEPPPPSADPASRHRLRERDEFQSGRLRPYELVLAGCLVLAGLGGLGMLWYYNQDEPKGGPASDGDKVNETLLADPFDVPTEKALAPKRRPARLAGVWELRADDGRTGRLILSPDGRLAASSTAGNSPLPDYEGHWYLLEESGDRFVLEFGREHRGFDSYKVTLLLTDPDAFTLTETLKGGVPTREKHRFIRTGPAPEAKAKGP